MSHPTWSQWIAWVGGSADVSKPRSMADHLESCEQCQRDVDVLRSLQSAGAVGPLVTPPDDLLDEIVSFTRQAPAPAPDCIGESVDWDLADVRGADAAQAGEAVYLARSLPGFQLSAMVDPPGSDRRWRIEGRLWSASDAPSGPIRVILAHDDHVLVDFQVPADEPFRIHEVAEPGWRLELHLSNERTIVVGDPFA